MSTDRLQHIQDLFSEALLLPADAQAAFLEKACAGDETLLHEVRSLLAADAIAEEGAFLAEPLVEMPKAEPPFKGRQIGPYTILEHLGRGGMGTVYLAERTDVQKKVALKLIHGPLASSDRIERFLHERRILAGLEHPNIARLLDAGLTEEDLPYLVMEYVDGLPIDTYCDQHRLSVNERLRLFQTVCEAVQYAHQHLVVHRDLKPSNILVTESGTVKLLDFGIAKLLGPDQTVPAAPITRTGVHLMTPEYASPEHVLGERVTTTSDVYGLGVLLYELLTGRRPYQITDRLRHEFARIIAEEEPTRPSTVLTTVSGNTDAITAEAISTARSTQTERLRRRLQGDLDNIILMALRKDPQRRYPTAAALAEDLERHLDGRPVSARPNALRYRLQKFVVRHRFGVGTTVLAILVLMGFAIALVQQSNRTIQERDKAEHVATFLVDLFQVSDPQVVEGDTIRVRDVLERGARRIREELKTEPVVQAEMMSVIGTVYQNLGRYDQAQAFHEEALVVRRNHWGPQHLEVVESLNEVGEALLYQDQYDVADSVLQIGASVAHQLFGEGHPSIADITFNRAKIQRELGQHAAADSLLRAALDLYTALLGENHLRTATVMNDLGMLLYTQGDLEGAEDLVRRSVTTSKEAQRTSHPYVAAGLSNLGLILFDQGDHAGAEAVHREALALRRAVFEPDHPDIATSLNNLAIVIGDRGDYDTAADFYREAIATWKARLGETHATVASGLGNLATVLRNQGDWAGAEAMQREALAIRVMLLGSNHFRVGLTQFNLAQVLQDRKAFDEAETLYRTALETWEAQFGEKHPYIAIGLSSLATLLHQKGDDVQAEAFFPKAIALYRETLGETHSFVAIGLSGYAQLYADQGNIAQAETLFQEAIAIFREALPEGHPDLTRAQLPLGEMLLEASRHAEAETMLREALAIREAALPEGHWQIAEAQAVLGTCLAAQNQFTEAEPLLLTGFNRLRDIRGLANDRTQKTLRSLVSLHEAQNHTDQAESYRALVEKEGI